MHIGIISLLIFILDIYVIYVVATDAGMKLLWIVLVLVLPLIGPILFLAIGREKMMR